MAASRTFQVRDDKGLPDRDMSIFLDEQEKKLGFIKVHTTLVQSKTATLLNVIVTKLDEPVYEP